MNDAATSLKLSCLFLSLSASAALAQEKPSRNNRSAVQPNDIQANMARRLAAAIEIRQSLIDGSQAISPDSFELKQTNSAPATPNVAGANQDVLTARQQAQRSVQYTLPAQLPRLNVQDVHSVLMQEQVAGTRNKVKQSQYLQRILLASNDSLDPLMIMELLQNRTLADSIDKNKELPNETKLDNEPADVTRDPKLQQIFDLYEKDDYSAVITQGVPLLSTFPDDERFRFMLANSLSWASARYSDAIKLYQTLLTGAYARDATLGLANAYRWSGRNDLAMPYYKTLIEKEPDNVDIKDGFLLADRAMRARTLFSIGTSGDSNNMQRNEAIVSHRWHSNRGNEILELALSGTNDSMPDQLINQRNVSFRYQHLDLPFKPTVEIIGQSTPQQTVFGGVDVQLADTTKFIFNRVNWGLLSFNVNAEAANLSASHVALSSVYGGGLGSVSGRVDYFGVSDGNTVITSNLQFTPSWRPLGKYFKPFLGIQTRNQSDYSPLYWSPMNGGYGVYFAGIQAEWSDQISSLYATVQAGSRLYGEGTLNWGLSAGARSMISQDLALGIKVNYYSGGQYGTGYAYASALATIEKLW